MKDVTKSGRSLETKLDRIAKRSGEDCRAKYGHLMPLYTVDNLTCCFNELDGRKAVGIDGQTKENYESELTENLKNLVSRMKSMSYRPQAVKEVLIPKSNGGTRPLGISVIEDKTVQLLTKKILEAIYEPTFRESSFGFRPKRSCHQAVREVINSSFEGNVSVVIDVDLENFFGSIDHDKLLALLRMRIEDERFIRYISRMLKAGIMRDCQWIPSERGTPQGSVASPVLANIFGHYAFDIWFEDVVNRHCKGRVKHIRYCDDMVVLCEKEIDAQRVMNALKKRAHRFGLRLNPDKTKVVSFSRKTYGTQARRGAFDFLGFTFYMGRSRKGRTIPKLKTSSKSFRAKLKNVDQWCRRARDMTGIRSLWERFCHKLQGHINYYCVSHNIRRVVDFVHKARRIFFKWMNRRSQRRSMSWDKFLQFEKRFPTPVVRVIYTLF